MSKPNARTVGVRLLRSGTRKPSVEEVRNVIHGIVGEYRVHHFLRPATSKSKAVVYVQIKHRVTLFQYHLGLALDLFV